MFAIFIGHKKYETLLKEWLDFLVKNLCFFKCELEAQNIYQDFAIHQRLKSVIYNKLILGNIFLY